MRQFELRDSAIERITGDPNRQDQRGGVDTEVVWGIGGDTMVQGRWICWLKAPMRVP